MLNSILRASIIADTKSGGKPESGDNGGAQRSHHTQLERISYSVAEAAVVTGLSRSKLYELFQSRKLESFKIGNRRLVARKAILELFERAAVEGAL
ncbi:MAG: helix-turn-helix domain-containing protein [Pseudolabrys sp.]|nr:helix-turn-helix domain-containing protein [Pseudolabrys sp.]